MICHNPANSKRNDVPGGLEGSSAAPPQVGQRSLSKPLPFLGPQITVKCKGRASSPLRDTPASTFFVLVREQFKNWCELHTFCCPGPSEFTMDPNSCEHKESSTLFYRSGVIFSTSNYYGQVHLAIYGHMGWILHLSRVHSALALSQAPRIGHLGIRRMQGLLSNLLPTLSIHKAM